MMIMPLKPRDERQIPERNIGVFAGSFDPVHNGHLGFALEVLRRLGLDEVWFLPEAEPRGKLDLAPYSHRLEMLRSALDNQEKIKAIDIDEPTFSLSTTMPKLQSLANGAKLALMIGSDVFTMLEHWPDLVDYRDDVSFIVGLRNGVNTESLRVFYDKLLAIGQFEVTFVAHRLDHISSSKVRRGDLAMVPAPVSNYIGAQHLYAPPAIL